MPLLKKVMDINGATVVVLPKQYTDALEKLHGVKLTHVLMEIVNDEVRIKPFVLPIAEKSKETPKEKPIELEPEEVF